MAAVYMCRSLRDLDPYHITVGAVQTSSRLWEFSDGPGALSIDVSLIENYNTLLESHTAGHDKSLRRWPMDYAVLVNCLVSVQQLFFLCLSLRFHNHVLSAVRSLTKVLRSQWMANTWWAGPWSPRQLNSATYAGATAGLYHNLYFALEGDTEEEIVAAVTTTANEMAELAPAFLS